MTVNQTRRCHDLPATRHSNAQSILNQSLLEQRTLVLEEIPPPPTRRRTRLEIKKIQLLSNLHMTLVPDLLRLSLPIDVPNRLRLVSNGSLQRAQIRQLHRQPFHLALRLLLQPCNRRKALFQAFSFFAGFILAARIRILRAEQLAQGISSLAEFDGFTLFGEQVLVEFEDAPAIACGRGVVAVYGILFVEAWVLADVLEV